MYNNTCNNSWIWIILAFLLLCGSCGNMFGQFSESFGCGGNSMWIILILIFFVCGCNNFSQY